MKPLNNKERRAGLLKFMGLFIVTVLAILLAVFFNTKIPKKENNFLRAEVSTNKKELDFQRGFYSEINELSNLIDSLGLGEERVSYQNQIIESKIVELKSRISKNDTSYLYQVYQGTLDYHLKYLNAKNKLLELKDAEGKIRSYATELENCKSDVEELRRDLYAVE